jgi:hypothetical protein
VAGYTDTHGLTLTAILKADGWSEGVSRKTGVLLEKKDYPCVNINTNHVIKIERVESICAFAGINPRRFDELLEQCSVTCATDPPPITQ